MYYGAAPVKKGETFDVTAFAGMAQFQCLRVEGKVGPGMISSIHVRSAALEAEVDAPADKHAAETHKLIGPCMCYMASTYLAWDAEPNHERITANSACHMQSTRDDMIALREHPIDPECQMIALILDVTTDGLHVHLCKQRNEEGISGIEDMREHVHAMDGEKDLREEQLPGAIPGEQVAALARQLVLKTGKDEVTHAQMALWLAPFLGRCANAGITCHLFLCGCNTINMVGPLLKEVSTAVASKVWVACTAKVFPSDLASWLWHLYGDLAAANMSAFREATRKLLDEFTHHWKRQRVHDASMENAIEGVASLADLVHFERLDKVESREGKRVSMPTM